MPGEKLNKIETYNAETLKYEEPENDRADEIAYRNTLDEFDRFITNNKAGITGRLTQFMSVQKGINNEIKEAYQKYNKLVRKYNNEIRKTYGANYTGDIDNLRNEKLLNAFSKKNEAYQRFLNLKDRALESIDRKVKEGDIPLSYYEDRKLQLENNDFRDIPPLFRTDKPYTMDEYIKLKHPNDYQNLSNEDKEILFNSYKRDLKRIENDFFSRKFLIHKDLTDDREEVFEIQKFKNTEPKRAPLNEKMLEAHLMGLSATDIVVKKIGQENNQFDEIRYLRETNQKISDFKKNIDKNIIEVAKEYKNAKDNNGLNQLPKLENKIDVFQKTTLKYLLAVGNVDKASSEYKDLKNFLIDGNSYINNVINKENKAIDGRNNQYINQQFEQIQANANQPGANNKISFDNLEKKISKLDINDLEINKYSKTLNSFDEYYNNKIKTRFYKIPYDLEARENIVNRDLVREYETVNRNVDRLAGRDNRRDIYEIYPDEEINNANTMIKNYKAQIKDRLFNFYRRRLISEDYVKERIRRLEKNDLTLPNFFTSEKMPSMNDYIKGKYPDEYNHLSKAEKNQIYDAFKAECEESRRQFILNKFLIANDLTTEHAPTCKLYEDYIREKGLEANREREEFDEKEKDKIV